jgi:hypothetical protein
MDEIDIMKRVLAIKAQLSELKNTYIESDPLQEYDYIKIYQVAPSIISNLKGYPADYKIFLEQIGEVYFVYCGCFMLEVMLPSQVDCWWNSNIEITSNHDYKLLAHTDNDDIYHLIFDVSKSPHKRFLSYEDQPTLNLLEIVEEKLKYV